MEWIGVKDMLPEIDQSVLWYRSDGFYFVDEMDKDIDWDTFNDFSGFSWLEGVEITHWMPLPEPPKQ